MSSCRPFAQVVMPTKTIAPRSSGNQPPSVIFKRLAAKNVASTRKKKPVASSDGTTPNLHA